MLGNARKNLILALVVVIAVGLVAYAQTRQKPKPAGVPSPPNEKLDLTGIADFFRINPANQQEWFYKMVEIRRNLMPPGPKEMIRLANLLGLTEEQKQSIKPLYVQFRDTVKPILDQRATAVKEFYNNLQSASPAKDALMASVARIQQLDQQIISAELDFWLGFRQILNNQQQQSLIQFLQKRPQTEIPWDVNRPNRPKVGAQQRVQPGVPPTTK